ncbi:MAG: DUF2357 domain-containing protein [Bacilli bacterium]|nr:DUF2357 domain-containing protein [Bacilli bacterium]
MNEELEQEEIEEEEQLEDDDLFLHNLNSTLYVKKDYDMKEFNYEWLDIIEDCIPYIQNILRNPRRFIINEEEIVKVELARRVTVESVIHLSQHTNLIQKIEDNGDVKPSKILNINKEESMDTYENRFIYTLVNNLRIFFEQRLEVSGGNSYCFDKNNLKYEANTKVYGENLKISIDVSDVTRDVMEHTGDKGGLTLSERIRKAKTQIDGFFGTELIQILGKLHVSPVRSPIKKTNVILKNPNFRKAEELWNYIQSFESKDRRKKENREFFDKGILKEEYDQAFLMAFIANKNFISSSSTATETNMIQQMTQRLIDNLLETDPNITEDKLDELFHKQVMLTKDKNTQRKARVFDVMQSRLEKENKTISDLLDHLRKEGTA